MQKHRLAEISLTWWERIEVFEKGEGNRNRYAVRKSESKRKSEREWGRERKKVGEGERKRVRDRGERESKKYVWKEKKWQKQTCRKNEQKFERKRKTIDRKGERG